MYHAPIHFQYGPNDKVAHLLTLITFGILGYFTFNPNPGIQMNVNQNRNNYSADINIRISSREHPQILSINNKNIMCLKKKGYTVSDTTTKDSSYGSIWDRIVLVETLANRDRCFPKTLGVTELTELTKEKLINDCKECNVHTEIIYKYTNIFGNETQEKKILHWDKHYVDQLK